MRVERKRAPILPLVVPVGLLLVVSGVFSLGELSYLLHARRATASVDSSELRLIGENSGRGRPLRRVVEYHFREPDGSERHGRDQLAHYWDGPAVGGSILVEYLPDREGSLRVVGNGARLMPALFGLCLLSLVAVGVVVALERRRAGRRGGRVEIDDES